MVRELAYSVALWSQQAVPDLQFQTNANRWCLYISPEVRFNPNGRESLAALMLFFHLSKLSEVAFDQPKSPNCMRDTAVFRSFACF